MDERQKENSAAMEADVLERALQKVDDAADEMAHGRALGALSMILESHIIWLRRCQPAAPSAAVPEASKKSGAYAGAASFGWCLPPTSPHAVAEGREEILYMLSVRTAQVGSIICGLIGQEATELGDGKHVWLAEEERDDLVRYWAETIEPALDLAINGEMPRSKYGDQTDKDLYQQLKECRAQLEALQSAPPSQESQDARRYKFLREKRAVLLLTGFFGNGCINRDIAEVDAAIDAAIAAKE